MAGTSRGNPVESIHDYMYMTMSIRFDLVDSTAFMGVGCALLYSKIPPSLVTSNLAICVNISDIVISVGSFLLLFLYFFSQELDLCVSIACLPLLTFLSFPTVTGVSLQAYVEIGLGTFPIAWFVVSLREKKKNKTKQTNKQRNQDSFVPSTIDLLQPRLLSFVLFESSWM